MCLNRWASWLGVKVYLLVGSESIVMALLRSNQGKAHLLLYIVSRLYNGVVTKTSLVHVLSVAGESRYLRVSDFCLFSGLRSPGYRIDRGKGKEMQISEK